MSEPADFRVRRYEEGGEPWQERADRLSVDGLATLRAAAERWSAAIGVLLAAASLGALLKGPADFAKLEGAAGTVARASFVLAVVLGLVALVAGVLAAQPQAGRLQLATAARLKHLERSRYATAEGQLQLSRWTALVSVALLALAAVLMWVGPREGGSDRPLISVRTEGGQLVCGPLTAGGATLSIGEGSTRALVPSDEVARLRVVKKCPGP